VVAAFDFDGSLTDGGSVLAFLVAARGMAPVAAAVARGLPALARAAVVGGASADRAKEELFTRVLGGLRAADVNRTAASFAARHLRRHLRPDVRARLNWHRQQGHRVVIVSASPECYIGPAAELLGADGWLATRLAVDGSGLLTGRYQGRNCRGAEKYARTMSWIRANGLSGNGAPQPVLYAYGNSRGDLRLMSAADHGIDVGRLGRFGRLRRFPRLADQAGAPGSRPASGSGGRPGATPASTPRRRPDRRRSPAPW
jgi:HAD superfamily hydrolase (TIGR01490 family)